MDNKTTVQELKELLKKFRDDRDWEQFHDPKNLAEAIAIESGELLELFLWTKQEDVVRKIKEDSKFREEVGEELADIFNYCLNFSNATGIDLSQIVKDKVQKAGKKYPIEKSKGNSTKYTKL